MCAGQDGQGDGVPDSFVESAVGAVPEDGGLVAVGHEVLHVTHLVMDRVQVTHRHVRAHLDPASTRLVGVIIVIIIIIINIVVVAASAAAVVIVVVVVVDVIIIIRLWSSSSYSSSASLPSLSFLLFVSMSLHEVN